MRRFFFVSSLMFLLLCGFPALAASRYDIIYPRPNPDGGTHFSVLDAKTLAQWRSTFGSAVVYSYDPFDLIQNNVKQRSVVNDLVVQHFFGAVGLTDWLEAGFDLPVVWWERYEDPDAASPPAENITNIGDLRIQLKGRILDNDFFGLGLAGYVQPPTGKASSFLGDEDVSGGALLVMDIKSGDRFTGSLNAGAVFRDHVVYRNVDFQNLLNLGAAIDVRIYKGLHIQSEIWNTTPFDDLWGSQKTTTLNADGGMAWHVGGSGFILRGLAGGGFYHGLGAPTVYAALGMNYLLPREAEARRTEAISAAPPTEKGTKYKDAVHFKFNSFRVGRSEKAKLDEFVSFLEEHPEIKKLQIDGHADSIGSDSVNNAISLARARAVKSYLERHGVNGVEILTTGYGSTMPRAANKTASGRQENRRVEITFL